MTQPSNALQNVPSTKRRTTLLLIAGALAGLIPRPVRPGIGVQKATTAPAAATQPDLKKLGPAHQVRMISYRDETFRVATGDGAVTDFRESDLRFKIDSSGAGPLRGVPVILTAGTIGDRAWVFFAAPAEIGSFIEG